MEVLTKAVLPKLRWVAQLTSTWIRSNTVVNYSQAILGTLAHMLAESWSCECLTKSLAAIQAKLPLQKQINCK